MSLTLHITTHNGHIQVRHQNNLLVETPEAVLPKRAAILAEPFLDGPTLYQALGGDDLLQLLQTDRERQLYLDIPRDDPADAVPWECAVIPPKTFLVHRVGLLRLVDRSADLDDTPAPLRLLALGADALVDKQGRARETQRLDILQEMRKIARALDDCGKAVSGERLAPTAKALQMALARGERALLHLSCHGDVIDTDHGPQPVLHLEDENGGPRLLWGNDLISYTALADLRLVLLSACRVGQNIDGGYGRLTRALVESGVPAAVGMQGLFPDHLSDDLAAALYQSLLNGQPPGKALLAARLALINDAEAVGLPVGYAARGGDRPLPLEAGRPTRALLDITRRCRLPTAVQLPDPFVGRNFELHALAKLAQKEKVITIIGAGGMGKTALAAAYARRFALRYLDGVIGVSFAAGEVDAGVFRRELLRLLIGDELADQPRAQQEETILDTLRGRDVLLLVDNYESVQQAGDAVDHPHYAEGRAIHGLLSKIAGSGGQLLLTSRRQPAGLRAERVFPGKDELLQGVGEQAAAELFYLSSPRALETKAEAAVQKLAREVGRVTRGHPLAVMLLGSEYDQGDVAPERFLDNWEAELQAARSKSLDDHHLSFAVAFDRSFLALSEGGQARLKGLSIIPFPFFAMGAAMLWRLDDKDEELAATRKLLRELVDRSLIEIDLYYRDKTPATWFFQPAVQQEAARRLTAAEKARCERDFGRYAAWMSGMAYSDVHKEGNTALVRLVQPTLDTLAAAAEQLTGTERLWHLRRVGWLMNAFGRTKDAYDLLTAVLPETAKPPDDDWRSVRSSLLYEIANLEVTRGDLDKALALYQESLALKEQIGDIQGKAASLSGLANLWMQRGDWDQAEALILEALSLAQRLGSVEDTAFNVAKLGQVAQARGDKAAARQRFEEAVTLFQKLGMTREANQVAGLLAALDGETTQTEDGLEAYLAQLPPEERAAAQAQLDALQQQLAAMSPAERAQLETAARLRQAVDQARGAAQRELWPAAISHQQDAVAHARQIAAANESNEALVQLSVLLYNLAGYYQNANRFQEAVACFEEVVALDEQTGHPDLADDRRALEAARQMAAAQSTGQQNDTPSHAHAALLAELAPQFRAFLDQLDPQQRAEILQALEPLGPDDRDRTLQAMAQFVALPAEEQAAIVNRSRFEMLAGALFEQISPVFAALHADALAQDQRQDAARQTAELAEQIANDADLDERRHGLAALLRCAAAYFGGESVPPIPAQYADQWAAWTNP